MAQIPGVLNGVIVEFAPLVRKRGHPYSVPGHGDHIHLSVD
jgi:hypothetical protein